MDKDEFNYGGIPVTVIKTDKFKSIVGLLCFKSPIKKEMMVTRKLIRMLLTHSCKKYPSSKELSINILENYGPYYEANTVREGNYMISKFMFRILEDKYTEQGNFDRAIDTFKEIIFNPNLDNGKFNEEEFALFYQTIKSEIESEIERPRDYTIDKLYEQMGNDGVITYRPTIEELDKVTSESLYKDYLDMIQNSEKELIIAGNIADVSFVKDIISDLNQCEERLPLIVTNDKISDVVEDEIEKYAGKQSILTMGLKLDALSDFERLYVVPVYSGILGGGASSRLFNVIREENSLAYFCFSRYEKDDSLMIIVSGIESDNYSKALKLAKDVINTMSDVSETEILRVKEEIISALKEGTDYLQSYPQTLYNNKLYGVSSLEEKIDNIKKVTIDDIKKVHKKVFLTNTYFLEGRKTDGKDKD